MVEPTNSELNVSHSFSLVRSSSQQHSLVGWQLMPLLLPLLWGVNNVTTTDTWLNLAGLS